MTTTVLPLKWIEYGVYGDLIMIYRVHISSKNLLKGDYSPLVATIPAPPAANVV